MRLLYTPPRTGGGRGMVFPFSNVSSKILARKKTVKQKQSLREWSFDETIKFWTKKITNYGRAGELQKSMKVFREMPHRNQVSWNSMLTVLLKANRLEGARRLFDEMPQRNSVSYTLMLAALSSSGFVSEARELFDSMPISQQNVFSWTAMISCYFQNRHPLCALELFSSLYDDFFFLKIIPNSYTFTVLVKSCLDLEALTTATQIQALIVKLLDDNKESVFVQNSLIDLYSKLGILADAEKIFWLLKWKHLSSWNIMMAAYAHHLLIDKAFGIFSSMGEKDTLSWNIMISGFSEIGCSAKALELFLQLTRSQQPQTEPNSSTYTIILTVCTTYCMLEMGRQVHTCTIKRGLHGSNAYAGNALINMYARCGMVKESEQVFGEMPNRDVISWNSMILGLGQNGYCRKALEVGEKALECHVYNQSTFIGLLQSCSYGGLVDEGLKYFTSMSTKYCIEPTLDHYICAIDMLARAGKIVEAHSLLLEMPFAANAITWEALLSGCMLHGNEEVGEIAAYQLRSLEPCNVASYVMLANIYRQTGRLEESNWLFSLMNEIGLKKELGCSWVV
ncbi:pentatricopeptide repeat-containing protein At2g13600-like [Macadamia integrifolia]|uniref:pentatricopeptide repeat-containing protein At2g13600-like n=1 Tax=Macadamia integrifolia TaxID=60698 RepID=UPI001C4E5D5C|nr:pentatricopeptide repeat-containing protein At2g13600-like [Macadamia integrifolia]